MPQYLSRDPAAGRQRYVSRDPKAATRMRRPSGTVAADEPGTWVGGAAKHLLSEEPAALGALIGGGALAAPLAGVGATAAGIAGAAAPAAGHLITRGVRAVTGQAQKPVGGAEVADVLAGPALQYGGTALRPVGRWIAGSPHIQRAFGALAGASALGPLPGIGAFGGAVIGGALGKQAVKKAAESAAKTRQATGMVEEVGQRLKSGAKRLFSGRPPVRASGPPPVIDPEATVRMAAPTTEALPKAWEPFVNKGKGEVVATFTANDVQRLADDLGITVEQLRAKVMSGRGSARAGYISDAEARKHLQDLLDKE